MKQLKFMLAAATAIGFAAVGQSADFNNSTNFENYPEGAFPGDNAAGWSVPSANASEIVRSAAHGKTSNKKYTDGVHEKVLEVSTDENPLLRYIVTGTEGPDPQSLGTASIYIDTMVQFTPTAADVTPQPGNDDKLMIYAKEVATTVDGSEVKTVNLFVVAAQFVGGAPALGMGDDVLNVLHINTGVSVERDRWYRLVVKCYAKTDVLSDTETPRSLNIFTIQVDDIVLTAKDENGSALYLADGIEDNKLFASIQGATNGATVSAVGFAGEGKVDDFVMTTDDPFNVTPVDFTLALGEGVSAVQYAINGAEVFETLTDASVALNATSFRLGTITYAFGYKASTTSSPAESYTPTADSTFYVGQFAEKVAIVESDVMEGETIVTPATKGSDLYDGLGDSAIANATGAELKNYVKWTGSKNVSNTQAAKVKFDGNTGTPLTDEAEAYLLNCAPTEKALDEAKAEFRFPSFDPTMGVDAMEAAINKGKNYNGKVEIWGADDIGESANWQKGHLGKFFKALLTK